MYYPLSSSPQAVTVEQNPNGIEIPNIKCFWTDVDNDIYYKDNIGYVHLKKKKYFPRSSGDVIFFDDGVFGFNKDKRFVIFSRDKAVITYKIDEQSFSRYH